MGKGVPDEVASRVRSDTGELGLCQSTECGDQAPEARVSPQGDGRFASPTGRANVRLRVRVRNDGEKVDCTAR